MGESRCELLESSSKMFYVIFHQETDPKVKKLFYEIIYCKCGAQKRPVLQGLIMLDAEFEPASSDNTFEVGHRTKTEVLRRKTRIFREP